MKEKEMVDAIRHIGIPTKDLEASVAFYELLGFSVDRRIDCGPAGDRIAFMAAGNCTIELYECPDAVGVNGPIDHMTLNATNLEAAYEQLTSRGYTVLEGAMQTLPSFDGGVKFFSVRGPNGEKVELEAACN